MTARATLAVARLGLVCVLETLETAKATAEATALALALARLVLGLGTLETLGTSPSPSLD